MSTYLEKLTVLASWAQGKDKISKYICMLNDASQRNSLSHKPRDYDEDGLKMYPRINILNKNAIPSKVYHVDIVLQITLAF